MNGHEAKVRGYVQMVTSCHICRVVVVLCCGLVWSSCCGIFIWRWSVSVSFKQGHVNTQVPCRQANKKSSQEEQHKVKSFPHTHTHQEHLQQKQQQQENSGKKNRAARLPNEQKDQHAKSSLLCHKHEQQSAKRRKSNKKINGSHSHSTQHPQWRKSSSNRGVRLEGAAE